MYTLLVFKGLQKTTLIDFPDKVACTFFLSKCNFLCPFCYNKQLVFDEDTGFELNEKQAIEFLKEREGFLDGVCITGGEPLLHKDIVSFLEKVKKLGLLVKIDTNGSKPGLLKELFDKKLLDYVAMDIKGELENYEKAAGIEVDLNAIKESVLLIREKSPDYEFRTTLVPTIHSKEGLLQIGKWLKGSRRFFLQQFNPSVPLLDPKFEKIKPFSEKELEEFVKVLRPFFDSVNERGI